jgi:hypothetical protein
LLPLFCDMVDSFLVRAFSYQPSAISNPMIDQLGVPLDYYFTARAQFAVPPESRFSR